MTSIQAEDNSNSIQHKIRIAGNKSQLNVRISKVRNRNSFNKTSIDTPTKKLKFTSQIQKIDDTNINK